MSLVDARVTQNQTAINGLDNDVTSLGTRVTQNQTDINALNESLDGKESTSNRVSSVTSASDNSHYPSAKAVYNIVHALSESTNQALTGYMQKIQSAIGGMVVVSKDDGSVEESGRTVDELMDVLFGYYYASSSGYVYTWSFTFSDALSHGSGYFSVRVGVLIRNTPHYYDYRGTYGNFMVQHFLGGLTTYLESLNLGVTVEIAPGYTSQSGSIIIRTANEISIVEGEVESNNDDTYAGVSEGDVYPWITQGPVQHSGMPAAEEGFYALNDLASDRYDSSEDRIYVDRITHAAYAYHDGHYHILKSEPHNVKTIEWTIPQGVEEDVWLTLDDDQLTAVEELLDASMRGQVGVIVKKSLPGWPYPVADRYDYTHRMLDGVDTPCLFHLWPYCPSGDITYDAIYLRMNNNIAEVKYTFSRLIVDE